MKAKTPARKAIRRSAATPRRRTVAAKPKSTLLKAAVAEAAPTAAAKKAPARKLRTPRKKAVRRTKLKIPVILLQGDHHPAPPAVSGPGQRYALGPTPPEEKFVSAEGKLPEAYGTKRLFLAARDPHWLYAHWDLTREQQRHYNARSVDGHLVLRVFVSRLENAPLAEIHVHPESRHWFIHVGRGGTKYVAELGYPGGGGVWTRVAASEATLTPEDMPAEEALADFATIPPDLSLPRLVALVRRAAFTHLPLALALEELRQAGHPALPRIAGQPPSPWTPEQERALAEVINIDTVRRVWIGSLEITELVRRQHLLQLASPGAAFGQPTSPGGAVTSVSSPFGGEQAGAKGFWFNVNAELSLYGATEPDAQVTIGGRPVRLRPDGSFSCRFALPDGRYELPAVAVSADQTDARAAELQFSRRTTYWGDVGVHPQDASLKPPLPENV